MKKEINTNFSDVFLHTENVTLNPCGGVIVFGVEIIEGKTEIKAKHLDNLIKLQTIDQSTQSNIYDFMLEVGFDVKIELNEVLFWAFYDAEMFTKNNVMQITFEQSYRTKFYFTQKN